MEPATTESRSLTGQELAQYRVMARTRLKELEATAKKSSPSSWIRPDGDKAWLDRRSDQCRYFDTHGFLVVQGFVDRKTVQALKDQMADLADNDWDPSQSLDTFGTDSKSNTARGDYFLDSSNRVHYFAEPKANLDKVGHDGNKSEDETERKISILNKSGHGMHNIPGAFQDYTLSDKMRNLVLDLGWKDPVVPQSMYIFKQAKIGGTVHSHQDSTFLYTTPRQTCLGLWLALDDATLENGCLWARPGSHKEPLRRQFIRNSDYFEQLQHSDNTKVPEEVPQLKFRQHHENPKVHWDGILPKTSLLEEGFIPVEVKAGDLVTFCGTLDHLSLPNFSNLPRHTFQLHLVEGPKEGITWSPENWLQYPEGDRFIRLVQDDSEE